MSNALSATIVQLAVATAAIALLMSFAFYLISRMRSALRATSLQKEQDSVEILQIFRELNSEGVLEDEEFRIIKRRLSEEVLDASEVKEHHQANEDCRIHQVVAEEQG